MYTVWAVLYHNPTLLSSTVYTCAINTTRIRADPWFCLVLLCIYVELEDKEIRTYRIKQYSYLGEAWKKAHMWTHSCHQKILHEFKIQKKTAGTPYRVAYAVTFWITCISKYIFVVSIIMVFLREKNMLRYYKPAHVVDVDSEDSSDTLACFLQRPEKLRVIALPYIMADVFWVFCDLSWWVYVAGWL